MRKKSDKEINCVPEEPYDFYAGLNIGSQTECTGMIPTPPLNDAQTDAYHDIYSVPQQCSTGAQKKENAKEQKRTSSVKDKKGMPLT